MKVKKDDMMFNVYKGTVQPKTFCKTQKNTFLNMPQIFYFGLHNESWSQVTFIVWTFFRISSVCSTEENCTSLE